MADVRLVDLDVFKRYSLAIRQEMAPMDELLAVLDATRAQVEAAGRSPGRVVRRRKEPEAAPPADPAVEDAQWEAEGDWEAESDAAWDAEGHDAESEDAEGDDANWEEAEDDE